MKIFKGEKTVIKSWCENPESGAIDQAKNLASLPFVFKHVALMPDTHQGYGMPIGGVLATEDVVIPNAVGVDIGCGMCACKTGLKELDVEQLKSIMGDIRKTIPVGFSKHKEHQDSTLIPSFRKDSGEYNIIDREFNNALLSLGTLGGGNHFIEIQKGDDGHIWIMIHSGSRNLGYKVAKYYNDVAKELNKEWHTSIPPSWDLAFLPLDSEEGQNYLREMNYCLEFAKANRFLMMDEVQKAIASSFYPGAIEGRFPLFSDIINIHHNYARIENHFGKNVMVHRKGATSAYLDQLGIIPGSQGTASYIVKGKGNTDSFQSCSHGAGRMMGRAEAKRVLNLEEEQQKLNDQGIIHSIRNVSDLDEASGAYKDIDVVMEEQKDLVDIVVKLQPLAVVKG